VIDLTPGLRRSAVRVRLACDLGQCLLVANSDPTAAQLDDTAVLEALEEATHHLASGAEVGRDGVVCYIISKT
jgi:hypothetical protein